jgi:hypothetical protein
LETTGARATVRSISTDDQLTFEETLSTLQDCLQHAITVSATTREMTRPAVWFVGTLTAAMSDRKLGDDVVHFMFGRDPTRGPESSFTLYAEHFRGAQLSGESILASGATLVISLDELTILIAPSPWGDDARDSGA